MVVAIILARAYCCPNCSSPMFSDWAESEPFALHQAGTPTD
jgi:hypothetical protein